MVTPTRAVPRVGVTYMTLLPNVVAVTMAAVRVRFLALPTPRAEM